MGYHSAMWSYLRLAPHLRRPLRWLLVVAGCSACIPQGDVYHCGSLPCDNGVSLQIPLPVSAALVPSLEIAVCRNQVCVSLMPVTAQDGMSFVCDSYGPLSITCQIMPGPGSSAPFTLTLAFTGRVEDFADGDQYSVQIGLPGSTPLFCTSQSVTYSESRPNGDGCDPHCLSASLPSTSSC